MYFRPILILITGPSVRPNFGHSSPSGKEGRKEGRRERRKGGRKERRKEGKKRGREEGREKME